MANKFAMPRRWLPQLALAMLLALPPPHSASAQSAAPDSRPQLRQGELIDYEAVLYSQPRIIDDVMRDVLPSDAVAPSTYFLGFASWAEQDVFIREVAQARDIIDERFGTRRRSVLLVNHKSSLDEVPLASVTNLEIVLARLGRLMRPQKDTLILFMTTHGIENLLAVQFKPFPLNSLTPRRLAGMLERAGIRNRIIIISACHSGSFIPALRTPTTLVMTAARTDRASFGCDNSSDWTFFGSALFEHALRKTTSLVAAFSEASRIVAKWEKEEKFKPSLPQIFVGDGMGPVLARLEAQSGDRPVVMERDGATDQAQGPGD